MDSSWVPGTVADLESWALGRVVGVDSTLLGTLLELSRDMLDLEDPADLGEGDIACLLLEVVPDYVDIVPEDVPTLIATAGSLLEFLSETGRLPRRAAATLRAELNEAAEALPAVLAAADDALPDLEGLLRRLSGSGESPAFLDALAEILRGEEPEQLQVVTGPLPAIRLPALEEVGAAARRSRLLGQARHLAMWVGWERRLTSTGVLKRADASAAITELGLMSLDDPRVAGLKSARDVPELHRLWVVAEQLDWVQIGAATTPKAMGFAPEPPQDDGAAMTEWYDAFGVLLDPESEAEFVRTETTLPWKLGLPRVLVALYIAYIEEETVGLGVLPRMLLEHMSGMSWHRAPAAIAAEAAEFAQAAIDVLADLGAVVARGDGATLTPIGAFGLRYWLVDAGYDAPISGASAEAPAGEPVRELPS